MSRHDFPAIGTLRDQVELFTNAQIVDGSGGLVDNFISLGLVWARVVSTAGAITIALDGRGGKTSHTITMRFRSDLKPGDKISYRGQDLQILSAEDLNGRRAYLNCQCSDINPTG